MVRFRTGRSITAILEFYLAQMAVAEATTGHRLVDVLDVHWYPEATGVNASGGTTHHR
jgi:hypothetical protein